MVFLIAAAHVRFLSFVLGVFFYKKLFISACFYANISTAVINASLMMLGWRFLWVAGARFLISWEHVFGDSISTNVNQNGVRKTFKKCVRFSYTIWGNNVFC